MARPTTKRQGHLHLSVPGFLERVPIISAPKRERSRKTPRRKRSAHYATNINLVSAHLVIGRGLPGSELVGRIPLGRRTWSRQKRRTKASEGQERRSFDTKDKILIIGNRGRITTTRRMPVESTNLPGRTHGSVERRTDQKTAKEKGVKGRK